MVASQLVHGKWNSFIFVPAIMIGDFGMFVIAMVFNLAPGRRYPTFWCAFSYDDFSYCTVNINKYLQYISYAACPLSLSSSTWRPGGATPPSGSHFSGLRINNDSVDRIDNSLGD